MSKRSVNPGLGIQKSIGYGPKISRRGIDQIYSQVAQSEGKMQYGGCGGPYGTPGSNQAGGLKFRDVVHGVENAYKWVKKNKPIQKLNSILDKAVPASVKSNPIYSNIRNVTGTLSDQLGIGQTSSIMPPVTYNKGMTVINTARPNRCRKQAGNGSKRAKLKQKGTGRKRRVKK